MSARFVMHDGKRWKVAREIAIDDDPGFELVRSFSQWDIKERVITRRVNTIIARVSDCTPDAHEPKRIIRHRGIVLTFKPKTGVVLLKEKGRRTGHEVTLKGLYQAVSWQASRIKARDKAFARRTRRRGI